MTEHNIPPHVLAFLREDMQRNPPPERAARMAQHFETPQGAIQPLAWDDLPATVRACIWLCCAACAGVLAVLAGMLALNILTGVMAALADPLAGKPW